MTHRPHWSALSRILPLAAVLVTGCADGTWLGSPAGPMAGRVAVLAWVFGGVALTVWVLTLGALAWAVARGRRRDRIATDDATTRVQATAVIGATLLSLTLLLALGLLDFFALRALHAPEPGDQAVTIEVTGHQWWWELTYEPDDPLRRFSSANELHIPVGRPVLLRLRSSDVIHSFWVPRLQGKRDLIPGYVNTLWIQADSAGVYEGACAEFCGVQHAKMRLLVVAEPPEAFDAWYAAQLASALQPADSLARAGATVFAAGRCGLCHSVRGTPARGLVAPDLTHLASRRRIAAGILPNTRGHLGGWIVDPQAQKPGVRMPPNPLESADLHALLHYLEGLR